VRYSLIMGFRFSRRIKLFPGVRLTISKSGVSTSVGTKGAWMTFGPRGTRTTVGIPGTGVSYTETHSASHSAATPHQSTPIPLEQPPVLPPPATNDQNASAPVGHDWRGPLITLIICALLAIAWLLVR